MYRAILIVFLLSSCCSCKKDIIQVETTKKTYPKLVLNLEPVNIQNLQQEDAKKLLRNFEKILHLIKYQKETIEEN